MLLLFSQTSVPVLVHVSPARRRGAGPARGPLLGALAAAAALAGLLAAALLLRRRRWAGQGLYSFTCSFR